MDIEPMSHDARLLRLYLEEGSQAAFAELVRRHIRLVYGTALRQLGGDRHLAEDATQRVFADLARKARSLSGHPSLAGWLFLSARFAGTQLVRQEARRRRLEERMRAEPSSNLDPAHGDWARIWPELDVLVGRLGERDRTALLLRFFEGKTFAEIGVVLGLSEDGARSRLDRTLEKLRHTLERRGVTSSAALLAGALSAQAAEVSVPPALASAVAGAAVTAAGAAGSTTAAGVLFAMNKVQIAIAAAVLAAGIVPAGWEFWEHRALNQQMAEFDRLQTEASNLRAQGRQLTAALVQQGKSSPDAAELAQVRQRIARAQARPNWADEAGKEPASSVRNQGWNSANHAYETLRWALANGNRTVWEQNFRWRGAARAEADAAFAELSPAVQAAYGSADRFAGAGLYAATGQAADPIVAFNAPIDPEAPYAKPGIVLRVSSWNYHASGAEDIQSMYLYFDGQNWTPGMTVFAPKRWSEWVALLDPASAGH